MKIIIFGSNGMLGNYFKEYFLPKYEVCALTRNDVDLGNINESDLLDFLRTKVSKGDVILNAAGIIKQRENHDKLNMIMLNSVFPHILAKFKDEVDCKVIHITTDCVFSGLVGGYNENAAHDCLDDYGKSKSLGENENITNIRTSIIGEEKQNKKSLLEWVISNNGKTIEGYTNHIWNGITCLELSKLIEKIIEKNIYWNGVRHVFSPDPISKFELVKMISEIYSLNISITKKETNTNCFRNLETLFIPLITTNLRDQLIEQKEFRNT